ncbi:MAG: hypothetical protein PUE58_07340 [Lachnospiraceae bacterium]|nr:hypothetical protein [Lachnospiraceae bacterium]
MQDVVDELIQKLDSEWQYYYIDQLSQSKANIFASSDQISKKRTISFLLKKIGRRMPEEIVHKVLYLSDLTDEAFRFCNDHPDESLEDSIREFYQSFSPKKEEESETEE